MLIYCVKIRLNNQYNSREPATGLPAILYATTSCCEMCIGQITKRPLVSCDICVVLLNGLQGVVVVTSFDRGPLWAYS